MMRRAVALLVLAFTIGARLTSADERTDSPKLPITIQIHDYWHLSDQTLARARAVVTTAYERIGIRPQWTGVVRQTEGHPEAARHDGRSPLPVAQVTVIILTPRMAARGHVEDDAMGFAAVPPEGMGHIAYAIYDRIRDTAARAAMNEDDLLGFVMTHEIAHLLLPRGSHTETGLMRGHWTIRDLQLIDVLKLGFSPQEATGIRAMLQQDATILATNGMTTNPDETQPCDASCASVTPTR